MPRETSDPAMTPMMPAPAAAMTAMDVAMVMPMMSAPMATTTTMRVVVAEQEHGSHGGA
jgi:hypothetical protein